MMPFMQNLKQAILIHHARVQDYNYFVGEDEGDTETGMRQILKSGNLLFIDLSGGYRCAFLVIS